MAEIADGEKLVGVADNNIISMSSSSNSSSSNIFSSGNLEVNSEELTTLPLGSLLTRESLVEAEDFISNCRRREIGAI